MRSNFLSCFIGCLFCLASVGCTKEGDMGPQGPAGPQGAQGNANVQTSIFTNQAFTQNPLAGGVYQVLVTVPAISADILQKGTVNAYVAKANNNNTDWTGVPGNFSPDFTNPSLSRFYNFSYGSGVATIYSTIDPGYKVDVKIVVVAGQ